jgi:hypothetical protein
MRNLSELRRGNRGPLAQALQVRADYLRALRRRLGESHQKADAVSPFAGTLVRSPDARSALVEAVAMVQRRSPARLVEVRRPC